MKPLHLSALALLLITAPCLAMMELEDIHKDRAKELGIEVRASPAGPDAARIELEFAPAGQLKDFVRVDLEISDGDKLLLSSSLMRETYGKPDHVLVGFACGRSQLDKVTLRIVTGFPMSMVGHDVHLKDFVDPKKLAAADEESRFLAAVRKAFDARDAGGLDPLTCWDRMSNQRKQNLQHAYAAIVEQNGVKYDFKLVEPDLKFVDQPCTEKDDITYRSNLAISRQLDMKGIDTRDGKTLFVMSFGVGEKDGKLFLVGTAPVK
jgi:hypothetical protein